MIGASTGQYPYRLLAAASNASVRSDVAGRAEARRRGQSVNQAPEDVLRMANPNLVEDVPHLVLPCVRRSARVPCRVVD